jgi:chromosome segregation ATPase
MMSFRETLRAKATAATRAKQIAEARAKRAEKEARREEIRNGYKATILEGGEAVAAMRAERRQLEEELEEIDVFLEALDDDRARLEKDEKLAELHSLRDRIVAWRARVVDEWNKQYPVWSNGIAGLCAQAEACELDIRAVNEELRKAKIDELPSFFAEFSNESGYYNNFIRQIALINLDETTHRLFPPDGASQAAYQERIARLRQA